MSRFSAIIVRVALIVYTMFLSTAKATFITISADADGQGHLASGVSLPIRTPLVPGSVAISFDGSPGEFTTQLNTLGAVTDESLTIASSAPYSYTADITITGHVYPAVKIDGDELVPFSKTYGTSATFSGSLDITQVANGTDNASIVFSLPTAIMHHATATLTKDDTSDAFTATYHLDFGGPASLITTDSFSVSAASTPEPVSLSILTATIVLFGVRRRR